LSDLTVCVVLVNYRNWSDTCLCVQSLRRQSHAVDSIVVVNNDPLDPPPTSSDLLGVEIVAASANVGFGAACNVGARRARERGATVIWFLNNDAEAEPSALEQLLNAHGSAGEDFGAAVSLIVFERDPDVVQWSTSNVLPLAAGVSVHGDEPIAEWRERAPTRVTFAPGCSLFMEAARFEELGGFAEQYFMYFEDVDLSLRIVRAGRSIWLVPSSVVRHKGGASGGGIWSRFGSFLYSRNRIWVARRFGVPGISAILATFLQLVWLAKRWSLRHPMHWKESIRGIVAGFVRLPSSS